MTGTVDLPPVWLLGHVILAFLLAQAFPVLPVSGTFWPGALVMVAAVALFLGSARWFRTKRTTINPYGQPTTLIVEGPYRLSRNPIYLAMVLFLLGFALAQGQALALLPVLSLPVILTRRFILREEAALRRQFGAEAEAYFAASRRWIGLIPKS